VSPSRTVAATTGAVFVLATLASLVGTAVEPDLTAPGYLTEFANSPNDVAAGTFFAVVAALGSAGVAIALYPALTVARDFEAAAAADRASFQATGDALLSVGDHAALLGVFAFCAGAFSYYVVFYRYRLIPRWLSGWGLVALGLMLTACLLALFNDSPVTSYVPLAVPIGLQEMVLAAWLLVRGFSATEAPARAGESS
jgi:hypothetical protein